MNSDKRYSILVLILVLLVFFSGCAVRLPKITATGERTALENQIIGVYKSIEEESWLVTSLRAGGGSDSLTWTEQKRLVLEAFQRQRFNADDIAMFKEQSAVGEGNDGFLEIRETQKYLQDSTYKALVDRIAAEENADRKLIMGRIAELHPEIDPNDRDKIGQVFARLKQEASAPGTWVQTPEGEWVKK